MKKEQLPPHSQTYPLPGQTIIAEGETYLSLAPGEGKDAGKLHLINVDGSSIIVTTLDRAEVQRLLWGLTGWLAGSE